MEISVSPLLLSNVHTLPVRIGVQLANRRGIYKPGNVAWT